MAILAALVWIVAASAAGLTPNPWHKPIAYVLIIAIPFITWPLAQDRGAIVAILFLNLCAFQLRLLLLHWLKRLKKRGEALVKRSKSE